MSEVLHVNREGKALRVLQRLDKRRKEGKFDFTIIVGNRKIRAEQNILASGSDYFDAMLSLDTKEKQKGEVEMQYADFESVETCIDYIYGRGVSVSPKMFENLMYVANMMQLDELCDAIVEKMTIKLNLENLFSIGKIAIIFGCTELIKNCRNLIKENYDIISKHKKFKEAEKPLIIELMISRDVLVEEERKLKFLLNWVKFDKKRKSDLLELLQCIDISQIPRDICLEYIKMDSVINRDSESLLFFNVRILERLKASTEWKMLLLDGDDTNFEHLLSKDSPIQKARSIKHYSVVKLGCDVYVLGEDKSVHRLRYSDERETWERMSDMTEKHGENPPATVLSGCIYVIGGHNFCITSAVERYDPSTNEWTKLKNKRHPIACAEVLTSRGFIYSFGGYVNGEYVNDVERMDVVKSQWSVMCPMHEKKEGVSAAECDHMIYVTGGWNGDERLRSLERYNPSSDQWTMLSRMNIRRSWLRMFTFGKCLYAVGGCEGQSIEAYDIEKDIWTAVNEDEKSTIKTSVSIEKNKNEMRFP